MSCKKTEKLRKKIERLEDSVLKSKLLSLFEMGYQTDAAYIADTVYPSISKDRELQVGAIAEREHRARRDMFAVAALTGMTADAIPRHDEIRGYAKAAYQLADAMLAEREKIKVTGGDMAVTVDVVRPVEIGFDDPDNKGMRIVGRVVGEDGGDWILDCGKEIGLIRRAKQKGGK